MIRSGISKSVWCVAGLGVLCWALPTLGADEHQRAKLLSFDKAGCPGATITVEIMTDDYGTETSWEVVEQGTGTIMGSGGGYANNTLYTADVCVDSTGCYDFTIYDAFGDGICCSYGIGYYNVYYNATLVGSGGEFGLEETVGFIGGGCVLPTGACCAGTVCTGTGYEGDCTGDWYLGEDCATFVCPSVVGLDCPVDSLFAQNSMGADDGWSLGTSEVDVLGSNYLRSESFSGVTGSICDIHWWGTQMFLDGSWTNCTDANLSFEIKFYQNAGGAPGTEVSSYIVTPTVSPTDELLAGLYELLYFSVPSLSPCTTLTDGWVSIQGLGDPGCWFMWMSSPTGDGSSCLSTDGVQDCAGYLFDNAYCLTGEYIPTFGACCDDDTGICDDNVEIINCTGRFAADTLCSALVPPCGEIPGACCVDDVCSEVSASACATAGGVYHGDYTTCSPNPCVCADFSVAAPGVWPGNTAGGGNDCDLETSEEYIYEVSIPTTGTWVFSLCGSTYDTKIHVGTTCCGSEIAYNDDDCYVRALQSEVIVDIGAGTYYVAVEGYGGGTGSYELDIHEYVEPTGACCESGVCTGTGIEGDCAGDWHIGEDCATFGCPQPIATCPIDALYGQVPHGPDDGWSFGTSEVDVTGTNYLRFESYSVTGQTCDIHWWGIQAFLGAAWENCTDSDPSYEIKFYADAAGVPGAVVNSYVVTPTITQTGIIYAGLFDMAYFSVPSLSPCVTQFDGWVSIQGLGDTNCWFLWSSSPEGDGSSCIMTDGAQDCATYLFDNALCLTGEYVPQFGACCDDTTGICDDNVEVINCSGRFAADTLCADLAPPCGELPGACCYPDGSCLDQTSAACTGVFQGLGTNCAGTICPSPGDDCTNTMTVTLGIGDLPYTNNNTNCGRGDAYDDPSTDTCLYYYDSGEDMIYELEVTETMTVRVGLDPHGTTWSGVAIGDACPPTDSCLAGAYASSGDYRETDCVTLTPGTYYIQVDTWSSPDCIPDFTLTVSECPEGGACCHPDQTCTDVANAGACADVYMGDTTTCATVSCPSGNDVCQTAVGVAIPSTNAGTTIGANNSGAPTCGTTNTAPDVWYSVVGNGNELTASLCNNSWDTKLTVYTDGCETLSCVVGVDDSPCARRTSTTSLRKHPLGNRPSQTGPVPFVFERGDLKPKEQMGLKKVADPEALQSEVSWCSEIGVQYLILVHGYSSSEGDFTLDIIDGAPCEQTYCDASGGCDEYIERVECGSIDNTSGCDGYADYTALSTDVAVGSPTDIIVTIGNPYSSDKGGLWIDWNQDLDFDDADEEITIAWVGSGPYVGTITPPVTALLGETRMRVRLQYSGSDPVPCGTTSYGEVEDYTVRVVPAAGACCDGATCTDTESGDCPGDWLGVGTACDGDCNGNGVADICDLAGGSPDCNNNGIPDDCELAGNDCNNNGIPDECEPDCNANGHPDDCDVDPSDPDGDGLVSPDCQGDGVPDECQLTGGAPRDVVVDEGFEGAFPPTGWENTALDVNGPWEITTTVDYIHTGAQAAVHPWSTPDTADTYLLTPDLTITTGTVTVWSIGCSDQVWCAFYDIDVMIVIGEPGGGDDVFVGNLNELWDDYFVTWKEAVFALNPPSTPFRVGFRYYGLDGDLGVIDDVLIEGSTGPPANDCNQNGVPDECDVPPIGSGPDCQPDGIPDACQLDGNDNIPPGGDGMPDECNGCGDGWVDPSSEQCDGGACCTANCTFDSGTVCRTAAGACDAEEACDGTSADCPPNGYVDAGVGCRSAAGDCDVAESCDGNSPDCPADGFVGAGTECRPAGDCDPAEACTGASAACPADVTITECIDDDDCCPPGCTYETDNNCFDGIPTMSQWGLVVLALVLVVLSKVYFGRRRRATA